MYNHGGGGKKLGTIGIYYDKAAETFLQQNPATLPRIIFQALADEAAFIVRTARESGEISIDTGALHHSGYVEVDVSRLNIEAGYSTDYATYNNEGINRFTGGALNYPGGGRMKWFDSAIDYTASHRLERIAERANKLVPVVKQNDWRSLSIELPTDMSHSEDEAYSKANVIKSGGR